MIERSFFQRRPTSSPTGKGPASKNHRIPRISLVKNCGVPSHLALAVCLGLMSVGCVLFPKDHNNQYVVCPYDTVWEATWDTMKSFPIKLQNKDTGVIETGWIEMGGEERGYGLFRRTATGFGNRERVRLVVNLKSMKDVTEVVVIENRERWHLKGGVTSQATRWWPIDPSEEDMSAVMAAVNTKLKDLGCPLS